MIRQFARIAAAYRNLIPKQYSGSSVSELGQFILDLTFEDFQKMAGNLPLVLEGVALPDETAVIPASKMDPTWEDAVRALSKTLPDEIDLTDTSQDQPIFEAADDLMKRYTRLSSLQSFDRWLTACPEKYKNAVLLVSKIALSKRCIKQMDFPLHVSLVVAMYREHHRIRPKTRENPYGEDFIRRKHDQMAWLLEDCPITFDMILVDDGCPYQSGRIAEEIVRAHGYRNIKVLYLEEGIQRRSPVLQGLESTKDSRKGGSIQYGMWQALKDYRKKETPHMVVYTDADMAAPVNQTGLLLEKQTDKTLAAIASRYDPGGICRGPWGKNGEVRGLTAFDRLMVGLRSLVFSKLFPQIGEITDTQCGLKAFHATLLRRILPNTRVRTFSFDIELLLLATDAGSSIASAPIYWHDSVAESSFWDSRLR